MIFIIFLGRLIFRELTFCRYLVNMTLFRHQAEGRGGAMPESIRTVS